MLQQLFWNLAGGVGSVGCLLVRGQVLWAGLAACFAARVQRQPAGFLAAMLVVVIVRSHQLYCIRARSTWHVSCTVRHAIGWAAA
jgi:hypothetical protein